MKAMYIGLSAALVVALASVVLVAVVRSLDGGAHAANGEPDGSDPGSARLPAEVVEMLNTTFIAYGERYRSSDPAEPACVVVARAFVANVDRSGLPLDEIEAEVSLGPNSGFSGRVYEALNSYPQDAADMMAFARNQCTDYVRWFTNEYNGRPDPIQ